VGERMAGGMFLTVTRGDDSRLCHGDDITAHRDRRGSMGGFTSFFEVLWSCSAIDEGKELLDVVDHGTRRWSRTGSLCQLLREPQSFPAHRLSLLRSRACAAETRSAHPRSLLQDRHAWSHLLRCFCFALTPLALNLLAHGRLPCTRSRLRN
jgi:hypothetical protein